MATVLEYREAGTEAWQVKDVFVVPSVAEHLAQALRVKNPDYQYQTREAKPNETPTMAKRVQ